MNRPARQRNMPRMLGDKDKKADFRSVPAGCYNSATERGIRVYTVGIGTTQGEIIGFEGWSMPVRLDGETLKNISLLTHGDCFHAGAAEDLKKAWQWLGSRMVVERQETEVTALFSAFGAQLTVLAGGLSVWWFGRVR